MNRNERQEREKYELMLLKLGVTDLSVRPDSPRLLISRLRTSHRQFRIARAIKSGTPLVEKSPHRLFVTLNSRCDARF